MDKSNHNRSLPPQLWESKPLLIERAFVQSLCQLLGRLEVETFPEVLLWLEQGQRNRQILARKVERVDGVPGRGLRP